MSCAQYIPIVSPILPAIYNFFTLQTGKWEFVSSHEQQLVTQEPADCVDTRRGRALQLRVLRLWGVLHSHHGVSQRVGGGSVRSASHATNLHPNAFNHCPSVISQARTSTPFATLNPIYAYGNKALSHSEWDLKVITLLQSFTSVVV